jgi:hypothetical protein
MLSIVLFDFSLLILIIFAPILPPLYHQHTTILNSFITIYSGNMEPNSKDKHRLTAYLTPKLYTRLTLQNESQTTIISKALELFFDYQDDLKEQAFKFEENDKTQANDANRQENVIIELQEQIKAKDDLIKVNEAHHLNRIEDLKNNIYLLDNQLRTKDDQIEKLNENMHKQAVHIQSLIQENSKLNAKLLPENTEPKKPWWQFW